MVSNQLPCFYTVLDHRTPDRLQHLCLVLLRGFFIALFAGLVLSMILLANLLVVHSDNFQMHHFVIAVLPLVPAVMLYIASYAVQCYENNRIKRFSNQWRTVKCIQKAIHEHDSSLSEYENLQIAQQLIHLKEDGSFTRVADGLATNFFSPCSYLIKKEDDSYLLLKYTPTTSASSSMQESAIEIKFQ